MEIPDDKQISVVSNTEMHRFLEVCQIFELTHLQPVIKKYWRSFNPIVKGPTAEISAIEIFLNWKEWIENRE